MEECQKRGIWSKELKDNIMINNGSIQHIESIPEDLRAIYFSTGLPIMLPHSVQEPS